MRKCIGATVLMLLFVTSVKAQDQPQYSDWLFVQSDKALQYRIAVIKQEDAIASLQLQFRVNNEDEIFCKSPLCDGMLLSLSNRNVGESESSKYSFIFEKSFAGLDKIYTWPQLLTTELKSWPDGSKRFFNPKRGIVYTLAGSDVEHGADVPYTCVDVKLASNPNEHRCGRHGFDNTKAIIVQ